MAEALNEKLTPIRNEITRLLNSPDYLENVLTNGNNLAKEIAEATWKEVCYKVGLSRELPSAKSERQIQSA